MDVVELMTTEVLVCGVFTFLAVLVSLQARKIQKLEMLLSEHSNTLDECRSELSALLMCERGMGSRLKQQQQQVRNIIERQDKLEISDGGGTSYRQAMVLLNKGASADELIDACDISRGELDLLSRLNSVSYANHRKTSELA